MLQSLLKATLLFADLDDASLDRVAATADERTLRRGDVLFTEGEESNTLYVVTGNEAAPETEHPIVRGFEDLLRSRGS